jgi:phosphoglycerate kinase
MAKPSTPDYKTIDDLDLTAKRVLLRVDFNVPIKDGKVQDATRIERTAPTIEELADKGAKVIVLSHLGRPDGKPDPKLSLKPIADALSKAMKGKPVAFAADCVGPAAKSVVDALKPGDVAMLENTRFHVEEEENDDSFSAGLARLGDVYVNDAFSCAHRAHASTEGVAHLLPSAAGRLMQAELKALADALENPTRPMAALIGGAKVSTKLDILRNLSQKVDQLIIGGAMANTFLHAQGFALGKSLMEPQMADSARAILATAKNAGCKVILPTDATVAKEFKEGAASSAVPISAVPADSMILDVGPKSTETLVQQMSTIKTLLWNGPMGAFEVKPFDTATNAVAREAAKRTKAGSLLSIAGGGDTLSALANAGVMDDFSYVSTAGGAFLEWLEGRKLPGIEALRQKK